MSENMMETRTIQENVGGLPYVYLSREAMEAMKMAKGDKVVVVYRPDQKKVEIISDEVAIDALEKAMVAKPKKEKKEPVVEPPEPPKEPEPELPKEPITQPGVTDGTPADGKQ